ncbi:MAG: hypothetical protein PHD73_10705 [Sediminibacterium sp.]|nr:hypothetical protein [Sediminibacterium sp.]
MEKVKYILASLVFAALLMSFIPSSDKKEIGTLTLQFNHLFNNEPLVFGKEYKNAHGEKLTVKTLNYFVSNIKITYKDGREYVVPQDSSYFLIRQSDAASKKIQLNNLPKGKCKSVSFMIGVDSARNTMDVSKRTGTLDVAGIAKGMYWAWNSGYIFLKFEGKSSVIPDSLSNNFYYHIGGFGGFKSSTINNIRTKTFDFPKPVSVRKNSPVVTINVDMAKLFQHKTDILLFKNSNVMWGELSVKISENYVAGFDLGNIDY